MAKIKLLPGSLVLNQDPFHPMDGTVIQNPNPEYSDSVLVQWVDGRIEDELPQDLILTGKLYIAIDTED